MLDFNSNGRFDDEIAIDKNIHGQHKELYPRLGDMLLVDPAVKPQSYDSPYNVTASDYRQFVSKMIVIDGLLYDLKISPAGDKLTLTPSAAAMGSVTNPNDGFRALIYGDQGFLKIAGKKNEPIPVPAGEWKLYSYTIDLTKHPQPAKPVEKKPAADAKKKPIPESIAESLAKTLESLMGGIASAPSSASTPYTIVSAEGTGEYKPIKVVEGETSVFPFGPPYKPVADIGYVRNKNELYLTMTLVGSSGEICSDMMVSGSRPAKPQFTIANDKGEVVQQGNFEYG